MVDGISGSSAATKTSSLDNSRASLAGNFDTFLSILTTQLKNQNPLDPLDTNQFTQQLVQFTGVEQQLKTNEFLETLMLSTQNTAKSEAVSYIGKQVTASGVTGSLTENDAVFWAYNAKAAVANASITIKNAAGSVVYNQTGSLPVGAGEFRWDGMGTDGSKQPAGLYTISIQGTDLKGANVDITTSTLGVVTGVDFTGDVPVLTVGNTQVAITDVTDVRVPTPATVTPSASTDTTS